MNILFASTEVTPFAKTGGLADVSGSLPKALSGISCQVKVIMPFYKSVKAMGMRLTPFSVGEFNFLKYKEGDIEYIFVSNDGYYERDNLYSEPHGDYPDNYLRFSYFSRSIASYATGSDFKPDVINCNDWQTGLVPLYLKIKNKNIKTLFTIHNIGYQGLFKKDAFDEIGIPRKFYTVDGIEYYGKVSFLKAGIVYSSAISTVSKGYKREIMTPEFGCGMDGILRTRGSDVYGILNGVDYSEWDPEKDKHIAESYNSDRIEKKAECKKDLVKSVNMPAETLKRPLIGVISRLAEQKGIDLIVEAAEEIIKLGASIIILGTGDEKYNSLCSGIASQHPGYISSHITFDNALAHKIEAGCDMFIMPSRYEPCGLNQLYSLKYGTLPIVRATGGLDDTIVDLSSDKDGGNGIKFRNATKNDMLDAVSRAIELYKDKSEWQKILKRIMKQDFSWKTSAFQYKKLYESLL
ncbi:MAG: glycogen synthase GlgA [Candidatus Omnitrophica bacterium]|nr:glycogen synthase GlgA [Candidatus Omnitrophota bacterium]